MYLQNKQHHVTSAPFYNVNVSRHYFTISHCLRITSLLHHFTMLTFHVIITSFCILFINGIFFSIVAYIEAFCNALDYVNIIRN